MKIFLTNDDGYNSVGITTLYKKLNQRHDLFICAPLYQKSGSSHSISINKPMELKKIDQNRYALDGSPADCVKAGLLHVFRDIEIDIIISGINMGPNMGDDLYYSGTVAAAREGMMNGYFSISASLDRWDEIGDFTGPSDFILELLESLDTAIVRKKLLVNINYPGSIRPKGVKITHPGKRIYKDLVLSDDREDKTFLTLTGDIPSFEHDEGSDLNAVSEGYVSVSPIDILVNDRSIWKDFLHLETKKWSTVG